ncbi:MAG TPA: porin family protein [Burkholderiales bacterium]|nr:porin family protein [Burkholderiales bacterium]
MKAKRTFFALLLALAPCAALADYVGVAVGKTNNEWTPVGASGDKDTSTFAKAFGGLEFGPHFALEIGVANLGKFVDFPSQNAQVSATDVSLTLVGRVQVHPQWDLFGRWGVGGWNAKWDVAGSSAKKTGLGQIVGLGFDYRAKWLPDRFALSLEWEQYQNVGEGATAGSNRLMGQNVDVLELNLIYRFNLEPGR